MEDLLKKKKNFANDEDELLTSIAGYIRPMFICRLFWISESMCLSLIPRPILELRFLLLKIFRKSFWFYILWHNVNIAGYLVYLHWLGKQERNRKNDNKNEQNSAADGS